MHLVMTWKTNKEATMRNPLNMNYPYQLGPVRHPIEKLDLMPLLNRSLVDYEKYNCFISQAMVKDCMSLQATRGCPFKCIYCHKVWSKKHRVRSAENLFAEVQLYYRMGVKRYAFVDDIFNFDIKNSTRFYRLIIQNQLKVQLFFPNGLRGDLLTRDYIDLMAEAGTVNIAFALETGSPRLQKLIKKHMNIEKLKEMMEYTCRQYPEIIIELQTMHGFPTETEAEAMMTMNFILGFKWLDFPYINILKIFPNTDMEKLALENGISRETIVRSQDLTYDELPETLPFDKNFSYKYQGKFLHEYFLLKDRLLSVLPKQMKLLTENEIIQKYNSYFPGQIKSAADLLKIANISTEELDVTHCLPEHTYSAPQLNEKIRKHSPANQAHPDALKVLLLDLSLFFNSTRSVLYDVVEPPLGLMYLLTYLEKQQGPRIHGKIAKSRIDFDSYDELKTLLEEFPPDVLGIRTLTLFKNFFHQTVNLVREWGYMGPIVTGGPYATSDYPTILQNPNVDLVVLGEGEITFAEIIGKIVANNGLLPGEHELKEIPGIAFVPGRNNTTAAREEKIHPPEIRQHRIKKILEKFSDNLEDE
jgi:radical SAM superfamily enzyme YgiQ (UPF0313 family)